MFRSVSGLASRNRYVPAGSTTPGTSTGPLKVKTINSSKSSARADRGARASRATANTNVIVKVVVEEFLGERVDEVYLSFTRFVNTLRQVPTVRRILPLVPEEEDIDSRPPLQYIFEPDAATVLNAVLPRLLEVAVYQAILESLASEHSARLIAMRNATDAAGDLISELTLQANKARQWRITKEMLEIVSGAEAMAKG